jgi:Ca2+-binding EF-hand superfamily protein
MDEPELPEGLTQEEIDEYREAFGMFDINGDGASIRVERVMLCFPSCA